MRPKRRKGRGVAHGANEHAEVQLLRPPVEPGLVPIPGAELDLFTGQCPHCGQRVAAFLHTAYRCPDCDLEHPPALAACNRCGHAYALERCPPDDEVVG